MTSFRIYSQVDLTILKALLCFQIFFFTTTKIYGATSVTRFEITWTFDTDYTTGQYANGDYWVLEKKPGSGVTIIEITPGSTLTDGRTMHGSMINPMADHPAKNGFDSALPNYDPTLNAGRPNDENLSTGNSLLLSAGSSLISSQSYYQAGNRPQLIDASVLTIVSEAPPEGSFRPPYSGNDKTPYWNTADLSYDILQSLEPVESTPSLASVEDYYERTWLEVSTQREAHPGNNQPDYGANMANQLAEGLLSLHFNYSNQEKSTLYIRIVQYGIDIYGAAKSGLIWDANGGHNHGRKMPMLLAGLALNDPEIIDYANANKHFIFQEDQQTFIVTESDVGRAISNRFGLTYEQQHVGLAEWGTRHSNKPEEDGSNWDIPYRNTVFSSIMGHALAAYLTIGAEQSWNWPPFFKYLDRVWEVENGTPSSNFVNQMWGTYRNFETIHFCGFLRDNQGYINTGDWIGWLDASRYPWMYSFTVEQWIYGKDPGANTPGAWIYLRK